MIVQSPLKKYDTRPNLRRVPLPQHQAPSANKKAHKAQKPKQTISLPKLQPWKVIVGTIIIGALGLLYLTHVFTTQTLLKEVQLLEADYNRSRAQFDELQLQYQRMIGPAEIYRKAEDQGFINGGPADELIIIKE